MQAAASAALAMVLSVMCYGLRLLTKGGCVSAAIVGFAIGGFGGLDWLLLLILFALLGFAATRLGFTRKRDMGVQEGKRGERGYRNILGVGIPPVIAAVLCFLFPEHSRVFAMMYIATVSVAAADTAGSELGVRDPKVWLIATLKPTEPGTNGGVSVKGTIISLAAAAVVSAIGYAALFRTMDAWVLIPIVCGFIGCLLDSLVGATLEDGGYVSKYGNNCITGIAGGLMATAMMLLLS